MATPARFSLVILVILAPCAGARDAGVLVLPDDRTRHDALSSIAETSRSTDLAGLSLLERPDSTAYYVVDRSEALRGLISARFADIHSHDSDISVSAGPMYREFTHLRLGVETPEAIRFEFDPALLFQVPELMASRPDTNIGGSVAHREYRFPIAACEGLASRVDDLAVALRQSMASLGDRTSVGRRSADGQLEYIVDGLDYNLTVRLNGSVSVKLGVSENDTRLFPPLEAVLSVVRVCSRRFPPEPPRCDCSPASALQRATGIELI